AAARAALDDRELERRQRRVLPEMRGNDLVGRDAEARLRAVLRHRAAQENGTGAIVMRRRAAGTVGHRMREVADDVQASLERLERRENLGKLEALAFLRRRP